VEGARQLYKLGVDGDYQAEWLTQWVRDFKHTHKIDLEMMSNEGKGFHVVP
jgi:hypothetical protein